MWLLSDIEQLGYPKAIAVCSLPLKSVVALVGTQFYIIQEMNPVGILGYIYVLESNPPKARSLQELSSLHKIPLSAMSTFMEHADLDQGHRKDLITLLNGDVLDDHDREVIEYSAVLTSAHVAEFFRELNIATEDLESSRSPYGKIRDR